MAEGNKKVRIIPLLIFAAFLSFSVRLTEVASGISSLVKTAQAESTEAEHETMEAHDVDHKDDGVVEDSFIVDDTAPLPESEEDQSSDMMIDEPSVHWRSASDEDLEYEATRMKLLNDLAARRKELDDREKKLQAKEALLRAAEQELDRKYAEMTQLRTRIENLLDQQSEEEKARIKSLVMIYEGMKAKQAARIFDTLDLDVLVTVTSQMSERKLSPILAAMNPERARTITIMLAEQKRLPTLPSN